PEEEDALVQVKKLESRLEELKAAGGTGGAGDNEAVLGRIQDLEARLGEVAGAISGPVDLSPLEERLLRLEAAESGNGAAPSGEVLQRLEDFESKLRGLDEIDRLDGRLRELENDRVQAVEAKLKRLERDRLEELEGKISALANAVSQVKAEPTPAAAPAPAPAQDDKTLPAPPDVDFTLDDLLYVLLKHEASELLIKVGSPPVARLHGQYVHIGDHILRPEDCRYLVLNPMPPEHRKLLLDKRDVTVATTALGVRFRLDAYLQRGSVCGVFKPLSARVPALADLGLPVVLERLAALRDGLVIVAGPPVSGKTTTLASLIDCINQTRRAQIFTIEDPIEYYHQDKRGVVTQREVGTDTVSFVDALAHALRQQADVLLLSDLKDPETMYQSMLAAETGHLVLCGVPSPTTIGALEWILNSFSGEARDTVQLMLSSCLRAVLSLRLLPRADGKGSVVATELMVVNDLIRNYLQEGMVNLLGPLIEAGGSEELYPFKESLQRLHEVGLVAREGAAKPVEAEAEPQGEEPVSQLKLEEARPDDTMMGWL
ncbi:MAG: ATPase, T2SS/T4P/T4SS family, partial [Candidatus Eremiobacterota bacterium]